jgi:imidazolonepropionase-like amidohydrolase
MTVIEAGTVHPVSGPAIKNGVVVIRGERILAVGQQGELELPPNTKVYKFPNGHVYPGLIDASTDAFTDAGLRGDGSLNGGSKIADGLMWTDSRDDHLIEHGITTAYISVRAGSQLRGQGAIVRPRASGFDLWEDHEQAALQLLMTKGSGASHALQRQSQLEAIGRLFDGLDKFREAQEKYEEELEKYETDFEKYLEYHAKKNGKDKEKGKANGDKAKKEESKKPAEAKPKADGSEPAGRRRGGRRGEGRPPRGGGAQEMSAETFEKTLATIMALLGKPKTETPTTGSQDPKPQGRSGDRATATPTRSPTKSGGDKAKKGEGPKRPKYPKKPKPDPQKEALLKVLDGELPLRIEAHRVDELFAALRLQRDKEIPVVVLERAYGADRVTREIAEQGATVVLTDVLPNSLGVPGDKRNPYSKFDPTALPKKLNDEGIPFAIASGTARLASLLPMMAAAAIGRGLSEDAALRAITLTPAEILGIAKDTGSLTREKLADVIVTDGPLFASDSRVLLVVAKGRTEYEAK